MLNAIVPGATVAVPVALSVKDPDPAAGPVNVTGLLVLNVMFPPPAVWKITGPAPEPTVSTEVVLTSKLPPVFAAMVNVPVEL